MACLLWLPQPASAVTPEIRDFLIQDVCVDAAGNPVSGDPYSCPVHRDLHLDEQVLSTHADRSMFSQHFQQLFAFPVRSPDVADPAPRVVIAKDYGGDQYQTAFGDVDDPGLFSYDVAEMNGSYVSLVGTSDPGVQHQTFWRGGCPAGTHDPAWNEDSWILFPADLTAGGQGNLTHQLKISSDDACPGGNFDAAHVEWSYDVAPFEYTFGKQMETIVSTHYAGDTAESAKSFERFYFTREYGFTRWESWRRSDDCGVDCVPPSLVACNGATSERHGASTFLRTACRDSTDVFLRSYPLEPSLFTAPPQLTLTQNLVRNPTFTDRSLNSGGWAVQNGPSPATARFLVGTHRSDYNNISLAISCSATCDGNAVFQDVDMSAFAGWSRTLRFGMALKADRAADFDLVLTMVDANGTTLDSRVTRLTARTTFSGFQSAFDWDFAAQPLSRIRVELRPLVPDLSYYVDEVFLTTTLPAAGKASTAGASGPAAPGSTGSAPGSGGGAMTHVLLLFAAALWRRRRDR